MNNPIRKTLFPLFLLAVGIFAFAGQVHAQGGMTLSSSYSCGPGSGCSGNTNTHTDFGVRLNADNTADVAGCYVASFQGIVGGSISGTYSVYDGNAGTPLFQTDFNANVPPLGGNLTMPNSHFSIPPGINPLNLRIVQTINVQINGSVFYVLDTGANGALGGGGGGNCGSTSSCSDTYQRYTPGNFPGSCGGLGPDPAPCQTITGLSASPSAVDFGGSTTLSWTTQNASSVDVIDLATGQTIASGQPANGSLAVTPASTRTYRIVANGACAAPTADVTVTVCPSAAASSFTALPTSINTGQSATLGFNVPTATSVTISGVGTFGASGSVVVSPSSTTTYTLTASGDAGCAPLTLQVTVTVCQVINSYSASATTINAGQSTTLSYSLTNASSATITDLTSGVVTPVAVQSGTLVVTPATTRTYRLTANGDCGAVTQDITITVIQPPAISSFAASASPVCSGGASTLSWAASGGTSATISAPGLPGSPVSVNPNGGTLIVNPASTTTYTLSVTNGAGTTTSTVTVTVTPAPAIGSYSASATTINVGQSTTLSYTSSNGTSATITDLTSGTVTSVAVPNGSLVVTPATSRTYRLTVNGPCGTVTQDVAITVIQSPSITSFTASVNPVCSGSSTTLTWASSGGTSASVTDLTSGTVTAVPVNGSLSVTPASTRTYRLTVTNSAGSVTSDLTVTVTPLAVINSYSASATTINAGQSTTLSFNVSNTSSRSITDLTSGTVTSLGVEVGTLVVTPASTRTYRLTATNGCNSVVQDITITVTQTPVISSFTASASPVCSGGSSTLSWSAAGGTSATISAPGLPGSPVSVNPNGGSLVVNPASTTTYTLTVTNSAGSVSSTVTVTVTPATTIGSYTASPSTVVQGSSSTLTWTSSNGTSATITDLTSGTVTNVAVSGSLSVTPAATRTYRLTVSGSCGAVTQDATVTVTPCQTGSISASASTITQGQSVTFTTSASNATSATITDLSTGQVFTVAVPNGTLTVTPATTRTYRYTVNGACAAFTQDITITVTAAPTGNVIIGTNIPNGSGAVGPTDNNDDYTNMTLTAGVAGPAGSMTTAGGTLVFTNKVKNLGTTNDNVTITARSIPAGFNVAASVDNGATYVSLNGGGSVSSTITAGGLSLLLLVRVTVPSNLPVLTGFPVVIRATSGITPANWNETIDRAWTGFVRADKSETVTNSTGIGGPTDAVSGATIQYTLNYSNVTTTAGQFNIDLIATNVVLTEDGNSAPNNWAATTNHVAGSASDTLGGAITGDTAGSTLLRDTIPTLNPSQAGVFKFKRVIK